MIKTDKIVNYLRAGFPIIWIKTNEHERIIQEIVPMIKEYNGIDFSFDFWNLEVNPNPMEPIKTLSEAKDNTILFAYNYHWFINNPQTIQCLKNNTVMWSNTGKCFVIVSHKIDIPNELEKEVLILNMSLPGEKEIEKTISFVVPNKEFMPNKKEKEKIIEKSKGLTKKELENIFALSLVENKKISSKTIDCYKSQSLLTTGFLKVIQPEKNFSSIIGYNTVKDFILSTINCNTAKGVMLIGPPGCGKTTLAKAIVGETKKFGLSVDMGKLFSKFVGDTDKNVDKVIEIITAIGNCFVLIDEFEKQFAGAGGENGDSGTSKRALSKWLDFLQNRPEGVYIVGTANSFKGIPPEYLRPGRWDSSPFYIDLPNKETAKEIFRYYEKELKIKKANNIPDLKNFSGAEIESLLKIVKMQRTTYKRARKFIIPIAKTMSEEINKIRDWAERRCVPADEMIEKEVNRRLEI